MTYEGRYCSYFVYCLSIWQWQFILLAQSSQRNINLLEKAVNDTEKRGISK